MEKLPDARFWLPVHPACAQNKTFISNTECICLMCLKIDVNNLTWMNLYFYAVNEMWIRYFF